MTRTLIIAAAATLAAGATATAITHAINKKQHKQAFENYKDDFRSDILKVTDAMLQTMHEVSADASTHDDLRDFVQIEIDRWTTFRNDIA